MLIGRRQPVYWSFFQRFLHFSQVDALQGWASRVYLPQLSKSDELARRKASMPANRSGRSFSNASKPTTKRVCASTKAGLRSSGLVRLVLAETIAAWVSLCWHQPATWPWLCQLDRRPAEYWWTVLRNSLDNKWPVWLGQRLMPQASSDHLWKTERWDNSRHMLTVI